MSKITYPKADTMMYVSQLKDPATGEIWVDVDKVNRVLVSRLGHTLTNFAYIIHDSDVITREDVLNREEQRESYIYKEFMRLYGVDLTTQDVQNLAPSFSDALKKTKDLVDRKLPQLTEGELKPPHIHIVMRLKENRRCDVVARWFKDAAPTIPELVKVYKDNRKRSGDRLENALLYLVHASHPAKFQYDPNDVVASFDYIADLSRIIAKAKNHAAYALTPDDVNDHLNSIRQNDMTRAEFIEKFTYAVYARHKKLIDDAERARLANYTKMPPQRIVMYVDSTLPDKSRVGKTTTCLEIARRLANDEYHAKFPTIDSVREPNDTIFIASVQSGFNGYSQQPIVVFDDFRAGDLKACLGSRAAIKTFLDPHPSSQLYRVLYDVVLPVCKYVLISGIDPFRVFVKDLASSKGDNGTDEQMLGQFYGRFWLRCTYNSPVSYAIYRNREFYPITIPSTARFYTNQCYVCAPAALMRSNLSATDKADLLQRGLDPLYKALTSHVSRETQSADDEPDPDLTHLFASFGTDATNFSLTQSTLTHSYDDTRDYIDDSVSITPSVYDIPPAPSYKLPEPDDFDCITVPDDYDIWGDDDD